MGVAIDTLEVWSIDDALTDSSSLLVIGSSDWSVSPSFTVGNWVWLVVESTKLCTSDHMTYVDAPTVIQKF